MQCPDSRGVHTHAGRGPPHFHLSGDDWLESIMGKPLPSGVSTKRWAVWLAATVTTFAAMEAHAVSTRRQPTLSGALRLWMGHDPVKPHRWIASALWLGFWGWLTGHLLFSWGPNLKERP